MKKQEKSNRKLAVNGAFWTIGGYGSGQALRLLSNLILARLLAPEAFGLMALVAVVMQGVLMLSDIGLTASIVQSKRGEDEAFLRTAWTLQVIRGAILGFIILVLAEPIARIYASTTAERTLLRNVLAVISLSAVLAGLCSTSIAIFRRRLVVSSTVMLELVPQIFSIAVMVLMAWIHATVWALVAGWLTYSAVKMIISHLMLRERRDTFGWDRDCFRELFGFGQWIFASTALSFLAANLDKLILGKLLSLAELGLYSIALTFAKVAIEVASRLSNTVIFPILSRHRDNPKEMVRLCLKGRETVLVASGAIGASFCIIAPLFFETFYKEDYHAAGWISQYLSMYVWCWALVASIDRIPLAMGHPRLLFSANVITTLAVSSSMIGYALFQIPGFIAGMALSQISGLIYVTSKLPEGIKACWKQSLKHSAFFISYSLFSISIEHATKENSMIIRTAIIIMLITPLISFTLYQISKEINIYKKISTIYDRMTASRA